MILSVSFSKPVRNIAELMDRPYRKIRVWRRSDAGLARPAAPAGSVHETDRRPAEAGHAPDSAAVYDAEFFTDTQSFRRSFTEAELAAFMRSTQERASAPS